VLLYEQCDGDMRILWHPELMWYQMNLLLLLLLLLLLGVRMKTKIWMDHSCMEPGA
jgi:hypothetical protein